MAVTRRRYRRLLALLALAAVVGCKKGDAPAPTPSGSGAPLAVASAEAPAGACRVRSRATLASGANRRTGLTLTATKDGGVAVGYAVGDVPHVATLDAAGVATVHRGRPKSGSELARAAAKNDDRDLQRVTPRVSGSNVGSFADFRVVRGGAEREVFCGDADSGRVLARFEGTPLLERRTPPAKAAVAPAPRPGRLKVLKTPPKGPIPFKLAPLGRPARPPAPVSASPDAGQVEAPAGTEEPLREVRDCRSVVHGADAWAITSLLVGEQEGEAVQWSMKLVADLGDVEHEIHSVSLGASPKKLHTFEAPVVERLADGGYVVATRFRGALVVALLDTTKRKRSLRTYADGYPSVPVFEPDGMDHLMVGAFRAGDDRWALSLARFVGGKAVLPRLLSRPALDLGFPSMSEPSMARVGRERWLGVQVGDRRASELHVVRVDEKLGAVGKPFLVSEPAERVYEARVTALGSGAMIALYVTSPENAAAELRQAIFECPAE